MLIISNWETIIHKQLLKSSDEMRHDMEDIEDMKYQEQVMDVKRLTKSFDVLEVES